jgi:dTMP kinase
VDTSSTVRQTHRRRPSPRSFAIAAAPDPAAALDAAGLVSEPVPDEMRGVLRIAPFRRLWIALAVSSLGDWMGLLATTALAASLTKSGQRGELFAVGGVLIFRFLPALVLGPFAGALADRFDRRRTMVVCDVIRFALFVSIPLVATFFRSVALPYLLGTSFLIESVSLFWIPAKEAARRSRRSSSRASRSSAVCSRCHSRSSRRTRSSSRSTSTPRRSCSRPSP